MNTISINNLQLFQVQQYTIYAYTNINKYATASTSV
jgi:hypothetical protein